MSFYLCFLILIPLAGCLVTSFLPRQKETLISFTSLFFVSVHLMACGGITGSWLLGSESFLEYIGPSLYRSDSFSFFIALYFDRATATFLMVGSFLTFLITVYSRYYMHREPGYKRFFCTIQFFYLAYSLVVLAGNFEVLITGWEALGISSFLLIGFYRHRHLPAKNSLKVFSVYRLGDVGLLLTAWVSHLLWHENILFSTLNNLQLVTSHLSQHTLLGFFMASAILLAAAAKSAQFPFSSWLPRAMEGPTPSSAIFYGSLSVHMGAYLLIRTMPIWENQTSARVLIGGVGLVTALCSTGSARVQSSIKAQVAYSSLTQIGIMFIELALGLEALALTHFASNAFLRTYQLLVSPSVVSYLIREQFYQFTPKEPSLEDSLTEKLKRGLYILSLKEWNLDLFLDFYLWEPFKYMARKTAFLSRPLLLGGFVALSGVLLLFSQAGVTERWVRHGVSGVIALMGLLLVIQAFTERQSARRAWLMIMGNHVWILTAVALSDHWDLEHFLIYLSGVVICGLMGLVVLYLLQKKNGRLTLFGFQGQAAAFPKLAFLFLIAALGLSGFPITPTFMGEDLIFHHIHEEQAWMGIFVSLSYVFDGMAALRIYARLFMGPTLPAAWMSAGSSSE